MSLTHTVSDRTRPQHALALMVLRSMNSRGEIWSVIFQVLQFPVIVFLWSDIFRSCKFSTPPLSNIFTVPIYRAHRAVIFAIAWLSCLLFLPRDAPYSKARYCDACRLSVTLVDQDHTGWKSWKLTARIISPTPSFFVGEHGDILGRVEVGWEKVACWSTEAAISLKRAKIENKTA